MGGPAICEHGTQQLTKEIEWQVEKKLTSTYNSIAHCLQQDGRPPEGARRPQTKEIK
jgi:hypothetical protein